MTVSIRNVLDKFIFNLVNEYLCSGTELQICNSCAETSFNVRRSYFCPNSPAGKGAKWEWQGNDDEWYTYDVEVQCFIEGTWAKVYFCSFTTILAGNKELLNRVLRISG